MIKVTADSAMRDALGNFKQPVEIRDADGKLIGYFAPASRPDSQVYSQAAANFDPEEMKRRKHSGEAGCTTGELLERLRSSESE